MRLNGRQPEELVALLKQLGYKNIILRGRRLASFDELIAHDEGLHDAPNVLLTK